MKVNELAANMYLENIEKLKQTAVENKSSSVSIDKETTESFSEMFKKEISNYTEMNELKNVLGGSVLGSLSGGMDISALSEDLLNTQGGREVISKLAEGHLNSIVLTDNSLDDNESSGIVNMMDEYNEALGNTESLESILDKFSTIINQKE